MRTRVRSLAVIFVTRKRKKNSVTTFIAKRLFTKALCAAREADEFNWTLSTRRVAYALTDAPRWRFRCSTSRSTEWETDRQRVSETQNRLHTLSVKRVFFWINRRNIYVRRLRYCCSLADLYCICRKRCSRFSRDSLKRVIIESLTTWSSHAENTIWNFAHLIRSRIDFRVFE